MEKEFFPSKRTGFWVLVLLLGAIAGILYVLSAASQAAQQTVFTANLLAAVILIAVGIWLLLRMHTLLTTRYMLSRGGLELRWGLRHEVIPMPEIVWIRPVSEFKSKLPLPAFSLPGVYFGKKQVRGLGTVEFAATDRRKFLLVACRERYFVISPQEEQEFLALFERLTELGSLESFTPLSEGFGTLWQRVWRDRTARRLILGGLGVNATLFLMAGLLTTVRTTVIWTSLETIPSQQLLLLPVLSLLAWLVDVCAGAVLYLQEALAKPMVYLVWGMPVFLALVLAVAMLIMAL